MLKSLNGVGGWGGGDEERGVLINKHNEKWETLTKMLGFKINLNYGVKNILATLRKSVSISSNTQMYATCPYLEFVK